MTANEFDELVARLTSGASRRDAMRGIVGGAITSVGAVSVAAAAGKKKGKQKKQRGKRVDSETNAVGHGKRVFCFCPNDDPLNCRTRRVKTKKFKKLMRKHPESHRGPCQEATTTQPPTTQEPTTTPPPTTQSPTTTQPPSTQPPTTSPPSTQPPPPPPPTTTTTSQPPS